MTLEEYEQGGKELYADFARAVQFILSAALAAEKKIKYQTIQKRAKSLEGVRKKLKCSVIDIEAKIKDLAGVRVIVYTNSDRDRLINSDFLSQNFVIDWDRTKFHYPSENGEDTQSQFIGYNYVIQLNDTRATLVEYERYAGLFCELQIQTILDHAWSEPAHNTIYKRPDLKGVGQAWMTEIEKRLNAIQQKYLIPAGYEFQKVMTDFELIMSGKSLIEEDILISIQEADDNNVLVELLDQYTTLVLPLFKDTVIPAAEIRAALAAAARKAVRTPASVIETPFGTIPGASDVEVLEKIIRILESIQYVDPDKAYATYSELYTSFDESEPKQKIITAVGKLAKNNFYVWQHYGPTVQEMLLNAIKTTPQDRRDNTRSLMIEVAKNCLESEMTDFSSTSKSVTWTTASITISDRLLGVRDTAMAMLQDLFDTSRRDDEREIIYSAMRSATRLPTQIRNSNSLIQRAFVDSQRIINFITERSRDLPNLFKEKLEHDMLFEYRRAKGLPANLLDDEGVRAASGGVVAAALSLRERFNADGDYVIFKTLVGFESVFDYEWDEDDAKSDFEAKDAFRKERANEYLTQVTDETADAWFDRLNRYVGINSEDFAMFPVLGDFIANVAQNSSTIGVSWLEKSRNQPIAKFKPGILRGLYSSDHQAALEWVDAAIDRHDDLSGIAHFIRHAAPATPKTLEKLAIVSLAAKDDVAVYKILESCAARPSEFGMKLARRLAIDAVIFLSERGRYRWTEPLRIWGKRSGFLAEFDNADRAALFNAICDLPKIDFRAEEILASFADLYASEIIDVFGARLEREKTKDRSVPADERFEAIPYDFNRLHQAMQNSGDILLPKALEWHRSDPRLGQYKSGRFVANMFPDLPETIINELIKYAKSDDRSAQHFIIDVMSNYDGSDGAFTVLKELVAILPQDDELISSIRSALYENGAMRGEFGYRDALIAKKEKLKNWAADSCESVKVFAENFIKTLNNDIAAAQQQAEAGVNLRKLNYGEDLDDNSPDS